LEVLVKKAVSLIGAAAFGAGVIYVIDPALGKRRRALARDSVIHGAKLFRRAADIAARDTAHRLKGIFAAGKAAFKHEHVSDVVLADRVRTEIGRVSSRPNAEVIVEEGRVTLLGPVAAHEEHAVLKAAESVRGIQDIVNRMHPYTPSANMQTQTPRTRQLDILQRHWAPATRIIVGSAGASMLLGSNKMPGVARTLARAGGLALIARAATNLDFAHLVGFKADSQTVSLQKTIKIHAPIERVYSLWTRYENFPLFMSRIREVRDLGHARSHWVANGPLGMPLEWDALITENIPNKLIAWRSGPGSLVRHAGVVRFDSEKGYTRVQVRLTYTPPAGAIGHLVATLFGTNPKQEMDDDLVRMRSFVETGKRPHDAAGQRHIGFRNVVRR
jgi:uncharacterized membrane protein